MKIECKSCGHFWDSSESDIKDMFICHKCGFNNFYYYNNKKENKKMKTLVQMLNESNILSLVKIVSYSGFHSPNDPLVPIEIYTTFGDVNLTNFEQLIVTINKATRELNKEFEKYGLTLKDSFDIRISNAGRLAKISKRLKFSDPNNKFELVRRKLKIQYR